ncbi:hypothetical protein CGCF415_v003894 [Colletotrichum fructicola]|nr:hypothetical protein CGCFRS4_v002494 [Colletotrichum fructicola]KAF4912337.1 hypothetical protein CGCF415_v003894 [Colletotrichum fructicola]KAF4934690.1 hypothetical protein CGCF245_v008386 [Colletotrichum fructicola]
MHYTIGCRWLDVNQHSPLLNSFKWWTCARDADLAWYLAVQEPFAAL